MTDTPPVCDYTNSDYQTSFWEKGGRAYEDGAEAAALRRLLPKSGQLLLELGAGAGRNTPRYAGFRQVVLLDYSRTQLEQARQRLGSAYIYVAADIYRLPFRSSLFDAATMIRTLHHMQDAPAALRQIQRVLQPNAFFLLEFANKRNLKAILRYALKKQDWNPFHPEAVEFAKLNFDFHPQTVFTWLKELGFQREQILSLSHFRAALIKRLFPTAFLVWLDSLLQPTGALWQLTPSVFVSSRLRKEGPASSAPRSALEMLQCPACGGASLQDQGDFLQCACGKKWAVQDGIYDFRQPL
ncbi:MAG: hypothetical protein Fur0035_19970 [Anaerolineales bacterium]